MAAEPRVVEWCLVNPGASQQKKATGKPLKEGNEKSPELNKELKELKDDCENSKLRARLWRTSNYSSVFITLINN